MDVRKTAILTIMVMASIFTIGHTAGGDFDRVALKVHYGALIDELISDCEYKEITMRDSRMKNIRQAAALACLKAAFLKSHKEMLIGKLITEKVGSKPYKIHYCLNEEFFHVLRAATRNGEL